MMRKHKERLYKCQASPHNVPRTEQQNLEECQRFERRKREEVLRYDKKVADNLDAKVSGWSG